MEIIGSKAIYEYWERNKTLILYSLIIAIISFGYELFNFSLSIDEEFDSFASTIDLKRRILNGRWALFIFDSILITQSVQPYLPTLITILCIAVTSVLIIGNAKGDMLSKIVFSTIFISFPVHSYYLAFNIANYIIGIGMVLSVVSFFLAKNAIEKNNKQNLYYIGSLLTLTLVTGIYQALIPVYIFVVLFYLLNKIINNEDISLKIIIYSALRYLAILIAAFLLYKIIDYISKLYFFGSINVSSEYIESYKKWGVQPITTSITSILRATFGYLLGLHDYGLYWAASSVFLMPFLLLFLLFKIKNKAKKIIGIALMTALFVSPFLLIIILGKHMPTRTMFVLPMLIAALWWYFFKHINRTLKHIVLVLVLFMFFNHTYYNTRMFYATHTAWQADRDIANRIIERIYTLDLPENNKKIPVAFIGKYQHPRNQLFMKSNVFGASFFEWDKGRPNRINSFFRTIGIDELRVIPKQQLQKYYPYAEEMPAWPRKGSVAIFEDIVIVKLSDPK